MQWSLLQSRYGFEDTPNFEGSWHLHAKNTIKDVALKFKRDQQTTSFEIEQALALLQVARSK
jgi:hypothetical protein